MPHRESTIAECRGALSAVAASLDQGASTLKAVAKRLDAIERVKPPKPKLLPKRRGAPRQRFPKEGVATVDEACEFLKLGRSSIYNLTHSGELPTFKMG